MNKNLAHPTRKFRNSASFGKRIEHFIIGRLLKAGLDVYMPIVDDRGVDAVIRLPDATFLEIQIKARSRDCKPSVAATFASLAPFTPRQTYFFVFYSEQVDATWVMSSVDLDKEARTGKSGTGKGTRSIKFHNVTSNGNAVERPRFAKYRDEEFKRFIDMDASRKKLAPLLDKSGNE